MGASAPQLQPVPAGSLECLRLPSLPPLQHASHPRLARCCRCPAAAPGAARRRQRRHGGCCSAPTNCRLVG
jgi:hypothetical protein